MDAAAAASQAPPGRGLAAREVRPARPWLTRLLAATLAVVALLFALPALAAFTPPPLDGHVVDTAGKLTDGDLLFLDKKLDRIRQRTGFEIVAFVVGSLEGEPIEDVAYKAFNTWQIGRKGSDNGVLLVIAPAERRVRIETGKGVGGALTDLQSNDIIRQKINPLLQQDRFREAIDQGSTAIARALTQGTPGEGAPPPATDRTDRGRPSTVNPLVLVGVGILVVILAIVSPTFRHILFLFLLFGRGGGGGGFGGGFGGGGSGYRGGGGRSGGGGSSDSY